MNVQPRICSFVVIFSALLLTSLVASPNAVAQDEETSEISAFTLVLETTDDAIKLTCKKGCAWNELSFGATVGDDPQGVDQYGMARLPKNDVEEEPDFANFYFTIERTEDGVYLESKEGSAWKRLSFACLDGYCDQAVDQNGMTTLATK